MPTESAAAPDADPSPPAGLSGAAGPATTPASAPFGSAVSPLVAAPLGAAPRVGALDVLRGAAILMMVLSGIQPYGPASALPAWMYHAQVPPPAHVFDPALPGITWVDLVFPFFLFAMGAAIPLATAARRRRGATTGALVRETLVRGGLLLAFAIVVQHVRPSVLGGSFEAPAWAWGVGLLGWALLWGAYARLPDAWPTSWRRGARALGWIGLAAILAVVRYPDGSGFRVGRYDIILVVLANMAAFGGLVYVATARRPAARYAVLALLAAAILAGREDGWVKPVMSATVAEGLFRPYYLKYLLLVLPGTLAGEAFLARGAAAVKTWRAGTAGTAAALALLGPLVTVVATAGLFTRDVAAAGAICTALVGIGLWMARRAEGPADADGRAGLVTWLWAMGGAWLLLGFVAEPFEGGIKKDASTFSYYFVTGGLAHLLLASLTAAAERFGVRLPLLAANGQNPMLAYVSLHNAVLPVLAVAGLYAWMVRMTPTPWAGFARGAFLTLLTALLVAAFTRRRWFWRT